MTHDQPIHGRGASRNLPNRFEPLNFEPDPAETDPDAPAPKTLFYRDTSRTIIAYNDSPDVGFDASVNVYRGCEHGCIYCYARPTHEYLGFSPGLDFERIIMVKEDAPALLRAELASPKWKPQILAFSGVTDCYQPIERRLRLTRQCLEILAGCRNPVGIVTKGHLVSRDIDVLQELARHHAIQVFHSITTLEGSLREVMEPRTPHPLRRLAAMEALASAGIPVGVLMGPIIPGLTEHEIPAILKAAKEAGAQYAGYTIVRLPLGVASLFEGWLGQHFPDRKDKILNRIRGMRGGKLNDPRFGNRMRGEGLFAGQIRSLFWNTCRKVGLSREGPKLTTEHFRRPSGGQMRLFE